MRRVSRPAGDRAHAPARRCFKAALQGMGSRFVSTTGDGPRQAVDERVDVDGVRNADGAEGGVRASLEGSGSQETEGKRIAMHQLTHSSFRSCVLFASAGEVKPRRMHVQRDDNGLPDVHMDNCFCRGQSEEAFADFVW